MLARKRVLGMAVAPLALVTACSGSDAVDLGDPVPVDPSRVALVSYSDCDAVLKDLRATTERQVGPYGLSGTPYPVGMAEDGRGEARAQGSAPDAASGGQATSKAPEHSTTNAHEAAADEPDLVKTDGRRIVALARGGLNVINPASRKVVHRLALQNEAPSNSQLLLSGNRALVLTPQSRVTRLPEPSTPTASTTRLTLIDLSGTPKVIGSLETAADYVNARQTGSVARVVVKSAPRIRFPDLPRSRSAEKDALERNRRVVRSAPLDAWLPIFHVQDEAKRATTYKTPCANISHPREGAGTSMLSVLTLDLAKGLGDPAPVSIAADGQEVYGNGNSLYVTSGLPRFVQGRAQRTQTTQIHKFRTEGTGRPRYLASGAVPGTLLNQYAMSEHEGRLRVATTSTPSVTGDPDGTTSSNDAPPRSQSAVYVLTERDKRLAQVGKVDGLGKGERIYSVRFIGSTAYVVTFRQVDPLYVVDLKDPAKPRVTGELKITGYSAYLHPTTAGRLLGVGQEADLNGRRLGMQVSLFDVSAAPRRIGGYHLPDSGAAAEFDPHAFLYWARNGLVVLPVSDRGTSYASSEAVVLKVTGSGVQRIGTIKHPDDDLGHTIQRSLIVGETLWTVSHSGARATDLATLDDRGWLVF